MHGRARIARLMLESDYRRDIINAKSNDGWTPLHVAAHYGRDSFVRLLLEFRAEVDPLSDKGTTPLQLAIIRERSSCVRILLDHSANIDIQNGFLLRYAVIKGNHSYCRMFLQRGADTNLGRLEDGQTPLHLSALRDDVLCAQMLYTYGADTNTRNYEGQTPVALSVSMSGISRPCLDFLQEVTSKFPTQSALTHAPTGDTGDETHFFFFDIYPALVLSAPPSTEGRSDGSPGLHGTRSPPDTAFFFFFFPF